MRQPDGKIVAVGPRSGTGRLRPRPLQPQRNPRHELLRRRQADDRLRERRRGERGGAPGRRQDRRGRLTAAMPATSRSPATTPTARSTRPSPATASRRPTSGASTTGERRWRSRATARSSWPAPAGGGATSPSPATTRTARSTRASPATASRRPTSAVGDGATRVALQGDGKIVAAGSRGLVATTSPSPATTPTARSTRASPATASRPPTSGARRGDRGGAPGRRQDRRGRRAAESATRLRPRPLQPQRLARHELLRRRQADDRLRGLRRRRERGGAPGRRQDRRGRPRRRRRRLRARPLQPQRLARHQLLRRRQADHRLRRASTRRTGWRCRATARSSRSAVAARSGERLRPRPLQRQRLARHELLRRRQADDRLRRGFDEANAVALQGDGKIVAVGGTGTRSSGAATSPSPATTQTARSIRASRATAGRRPTGLRGGEWWRSGDGKIVVGGRLALQGDGADRASGGRRRPLRLRRGGVQSTAQRRDARRLRPRPLQRERLAGHHLLRRRQADHRPSARLATQTTAWRSRRRQDRRGRLSFDGTDYDFALARYNSNGSLDTTFSGDGKQTTDFAGAEATAVACRATARSSRSARLRRAGDDFALARYNSNGSLDTTFCGDGEQTTDFGDSDGANGVGLQGGRQDRRGGLHRAAQQRLRARPLQHRTARSTRPSPATASRRPTSAAPPRANGVAIKSTGRIIVAGGGGASGDFAIARYNPTGSLDTSFSGDGKQTTDFGGAGERANAVALQGDVQDRRGRVSASALTEQGTSRLARYKGS